jgi:hypothetical protein
MRVRTAR